MEVKILDILGQTCPSCLLIALKEINLNYEKLRKGELKIVIKTDHRDATRTIPEAAKAMGYEVEVEKIHTYYEITIFKINKRR